MNSNLSSESAGESLPEWFLKHLRDLEDAYLAHDDPIKQSGFHGGPERWRAEREPILDAVEGDGDFLDVGCANGYLLECLVQWARERGRRLTPYGVDIGSRLIDLASKRSPQFASHLYVADAWNWRPPRRFRYVYTLIDNVPESVVQPYVRRLLDRVVEPGGRLIVGHYGSRSRGTPPLPVADLLASFGLAVMGSSSGGEPPVTRFAWVNRM
jgi:SAM-dependent methyltransferase